MRSPGMIRQVLFASLGAAGWLRQRELTTLLALFIVAAASWGFVELADEVLEGSTNAVDEAILLALRDADEPPSPLGPWWMEEMGRDVTALGSVSVLTLVTLAAIGYLLLRRRFRTSRFVLLAVGGGMLLSSLMKESFARPRPDVVPHAAPVSTASFPSGHSLMAGVTYLTLAAILVRVQPRRRLKLYVLGVAAAMTVLVGVSRVYLGVHWPTDVLAGWTAATAWALAWWLIARWLQTHGELDPEVAEDERAGQLGARMVR